MSVQQATASILFVGTELDQPYLPQLKACLQSNFAVIPRIALLLQPFSMLIELEAYCNQRGITQVITTQETLCSQVLGLPAKEISVQNYAGSMLHYKHITVLVVPPLAQLVTVRHGEFMMRRYVSKYLDAKRWPAKIPLTWAAVEDHTKLQAYFDLFQSAVLVAVDIETAKTIKGEYCPHITCISYCAFHLDSEGRFKATAISFPIDSMLAVTWMRKFNWELQAPKVLQNGKYDCAYMQAYNAPLYRYSLDTATMMHCWYCELPKDLGFLGAFFVLDTQYWKDLAKTNDTYEYYHYNCLDTYNTGCVALAWLDQAPEWAHENYKQEFPLIFPCIVCEATGIRQDEERRAKASVEIEAAIQAEQESLERMLGVKGKHHPTKGYLPGFNPGSPPQVKKLLTVLGCSDIKTTEEKELNKAAYRHPLNGIIIEKILNLRGLRKLASTYLVAGKAFKGRILYALNPHGTDTGRLASREHHFWIGLQIQNIPRGREVKDTLGSDPGFALGEFDFEQAESRDTAYCAGEERLIKAVTGEQDFHSVNASAFFGRPYESIYSDELKKAVDKLLRDLAKKVNHGANYLMGEGVLVDTMGLKHIFSAGAAIGLKTTKPKQIAGALLSRFHGTYPGLSGVFYPAVVQEVKTTRMLVSRNITGYKWTRYCFGRPDLNKSDKNAYVAQIAQSYNGKKLNIAFLRVFNNIWRPFHKDFKLHAQIHDSIFFSYRLGTEDKIVPLMYECMAVETTVLAYTGKTYTYTVPAAAKMGKPGKPALLWSETE